MANVRLGFENILLKRLFYIALWHVAFQLIILQFVVTVTYGKEIWSFRWLWNLFNLRFFGTVVLQSLLSILFITTESTQYLKVDQYATVSRIRYFCAELSPSNFVWFIVYLLRGILVKILLYFALRLDNSDDTHNTVETNVILTCNAVLVNISCFLHDFLYRKHFRYFSLVQSNHSIMLPKIIVTVKDVSVKSFYYCAIFLFFYFLTGRVICSSVCSLFSFNCNITYSTVLNKFVLYHLWLLNSFILFNNLILKYLFDVFLTKPITFPIVGDSMDKDAITLKDALATHNVPLIQYLGYLDLNVISQFDEARRRQIFMLSYPGGHPHTWKKLSELAIKLITDTSDQLESIVSVRSKFIDETYKYMPESYYANMRPLSISKFTYGKRFPNEQLEDISFVTQVETYVKNLRPVAYLTEEMKEKQLESMLQHYQALSLACYSLANLAAASKVEDNFGIVQLDLVTIINALLRLYVTLNKLVVVANKKPNSSIIQVKKYLLNVVKSSLYKMSTEFGVYIKDLSLPAENEKLFTNFILSKC